MSNGDVDIETLSAETVDDHLPALAALLNACVQDGASISFVLPHSLDDSLAFWTGKVRPGVLAGTRIVLVARLGARLAGSVQLDRDTPPNQAHRAEVSKLLVHPDCRRRGIARALMVELERHARHLGRTLITLDTRTGDRAEPLYLSLGYRRAGVIPQFARDPMGTDRYDSTTIMYKTLACWDRRARRRPGAGPTGAQPVGDQPSRPFQRK